jgi:pimeloyl-ACP methyl ester carboxylesterase
MPYLKYNDIVLFYIEEGKGEPLILISGLGSKNSWHFQIPFFKEKMRVVALHNRGTGKSSRPNYSYTLEMFINDIIALLDHLQIRQKIHLAGISMGGMIAQEFVLKYPEKVKDLILCATSPIHIGSNIVESQKMMQDFSWEQKFKVRASALYARSYKKKLKRDVNLYKKLEQEFIEDATEVKDWINQGAAITNFDVTEHIHDIKLPTLILTGDEDSIINYQNSMILHEKIPNSILEVVPNSGHGFNVEESERVNQVIWNFIKMHLN